jgi:hypothetical protein
MSRNFFGYNLLKELLHPTYSSDTSPSDFNLFGKVNITLIGREIPDEINFLEAVTQILNGIADDELQCVFRSWIERVERVIDATGGDLTESIFPFSLAHSRSTSFWL